MNGDETEPRPGGNLPFISDATRQQILEELGLGLDPQSVDIVAGITKKMPARHELRRDMARDTFTTLADINRPFVQAIQEAVKEGTYLSSIRDHRDEVIEGMAIVLRTFDIEASFNLSERFASLQSNDIERAKEIIKESLGGTEGKGDKDHLESILTSPRIPDQQVNLNSIINTSNSHSMSTRHVREGAVAMYRVLSEFQPKLFP